MWKSAAVLAAVLVVGCGQAADDEASNIGPDGAAGTGGASSLTCTPCTQSSDCGPDAACVQYAGSDYCGSLCDGSACADGETCLDAVAEDGTPVSVCAPQSGTCGQSGCGTCAPGETCDLVSGECLAPEPDAGDDGGADDLDGGSDLDGGADLDGGSDAGAEQPGVGPTGGKVNLLYFAIVGDTRPPGSDGTNNYPTKTITKIYKDFEALKPRPQFIVATGDYMFANPHGTEGAKQLALYVGARKNYSGTVFASLGNHECGGGNANCAGVTNNNSYNAFLDKLIKPLGKTKPYYAVKIDDLGGKWTSKFLITACNAWSAAQKTWLQNQLAKPTTYTFVARHHPIGSDAPCNAEMDKILAGAKYDMLLVGHQHLWNWVGAKKQLIEGLGGAPVTKAGQVHGFATVHQLAGGGFRVRQYAAGDISKPLQVFTVQ